MKTLHIGFIPLTDAAGLIATVDFGFAESHGLRIELHKEVSWANLRDKLMVGAFDAAHFLGAATIAASLGIGQRRYPLRAVMALNRNGNAITLATRVADELLALDPAALDDWTSTARALAKAAVARKATGRHALTFGTVYPFSTHTYLLRRFLAAGGLDPDQDVEIIVTPPSLAMDLADRGLVDGFCVGSPWNSLAVDLGKGVIAALGCEVVPNAPEKMLVLPAASPLQSAQEGEALIRAVHGGSAFAADPANWRDLSKVLARPDRIDCAAEVIERTLDGNLLIGSAGQRRNDPQFLLLHGETLHRPASADATWLLGQMIEAGQAPAVAATRLEEAAQAFDASLYDRAMSPPLAAD
jgi:ABC-type nitrate/sulfonate/bicarbonate transport system substrate-binding protein